MITAKDIQYTRVEEPFWGVPREMPRIPDQVYRRRLEKTLAEMEKGSLDFLLVYADREHYGNFDYLAGYGPRFEEALLVIDKRENPTPCWAMNAWGSAGSAGSPARRSSASLFPFPTSRLSSTRIWKRFFGRSAFHRNTVWGWWDGN